MSEIFSFFFKFAPFHFREGDFFFQAPFPLWAWLVGGAAIGSALVFAYRAHFQRLGVRPALFYLILRSALLMTLAFVLMEPALRMQSVVPKQNLLAIVLDNSESLALVEDGLPRGRAVSEAFASNSSLVERLNELFHLRWIGFDSQARRVEGGEALDFSGDQTNLAAGLRRTLSETSNLPLGGVVLVTDGSDNSHSDASAVIDEFKTRGVPIHTVGVGRERPVADVELAQVSLPDALLPDTAATARVALRQNGFTGSRGQLQVREGGTLVSTQEVYFPPGSSLQTVEVPIRPQTEGVKKYEFHLVPLSGEENERNNRRRAVLEVRNTLPRILYVEGRPRWEFKFIRQSVAEDEHLRLETLLRTALNKFYRQGIAEETTLAAGFPTTREDLFGYSGIIFGDVESGFFEFSQLEMVRDFVGKRGGGFLMSGGRASFSAGAYQNTPIEEVLPFWLEPPKAQGRVEPFRSVVGQAVLTDYGDIHPSFQLVEDASGQEAWEQLPALADRNQVGSLKPGAVILANMRIGGEESPLYAYHRFGRGIGMAFLTGSSWRWQMLMPADDDSHETFWRQILRWLVSTAREPVSVETERNQYARNQPVGIRAEVSDARFERVNDAVVLAELTSDSGERWELPLQWNVREDGVYEGVWTAAEDGLYRVAVRADQGSSPDARSLGTAHTHLMVSTVDREFFDTAQKRDFLVKIAEDTGGRYYPIEEASRLADEIRYSSGQTTQTEALPLWDMPFLFFLMVGLLLTEWISRKRFYPV